MLDSVPVSLDEAHIFSPMGTIHIYKTLKRERSSDIRAIEAKRNPSDFRFHIIKNTHRVSMFLRLGDPTKKFLFWAVCHKNWFRVGTWRREAVGVIRF